MINSPTVVGEAEAKLYIPTASDIEEFEKWKAEIGINPTEDEHVAEIPKYSMLNNYKRVSSWEVLGEYINRGGKIYYLVFKPKNKRYDPKKNLIDHVRKKCGKFGVIIITREIEATKVHYNVLVRSEEDLMKLNDTQDSRFYIYCKEVPNKTADLLRVHDYIIKESQKRYFYEDIDIYSFYKTRKKNNNTVPIRLFG